MADTDRRIIVEGVEFAQLVQFPKILRAITSSFQPPRLLLGLLMVASLMTAGRVWDAVFTPSVAPGGLLAAPWTELDSQASQEVLITALRQYEIGDEQPAGPLDPRDVVEQVQASYADRRDALVGDADTEAGQAELRAADEAFLRTVDEIERVRPQGVFEATVGHVVEGFNRAVRGVVYVDFEEFFGGLTDLFVWTPLGAWRQDPVFTVFYGLLFIVIAALGGGGLCRAAAVDVAQGDRLRLQEALDFAFANWWRLVFSLLLPLLLAGLLAAVLLIGGVVVMLPWLDVLGGLLYGAALLIGFLVVFLLVGYAAGFSLLLPAVACENCDAADAQQRAYAYVLSRPLHLLGYGFVACVGLAVGFVVASLFAVGVLNVTGGLMDAATANAAVEVSHGFQLFDLSPRRAAALPMATHSRWSAGLVMMWQTLVVCLVAGYVLTHYFTACTTVYMLMRRASDGQEMNEIWEPGVVPGGIGGDDLDDEAETEQR